MSNLRPLAALSALSALRILEQLRRWIVGFRREAETMATAGGGRDGGEEMDCWYADAQPLDATLCAIAKEYRGELEDASLEGANTVEWVDKDNGSTRIKLN